MPKKLFLPVFALLTILTLSYAFLSRAAEESGAAEGLTVSPPIREVSLKPGEIYSDTVRLTNPTQNVVELYPKTMNFEARGEGGDPSFYEADDTNHKYALASWISYDQPKIALAPQQVVEFKYQMKVPLDAEPGGHYGVIFFATNPPEKTEGTSQVSIASMVGSLILVRIPGNIKEEGLLEKFYSLKNLYVTTPVVFNTLVKNTGNIHFKPEGEIKIKNLWGGEVASMVFNAAKGNVLPDSSRKFEEKWAPATEPFYKQPIGRFTANLQLEYGEAAKGLTSVVAFWVFPKWFIVTVAILLLALAFFLIRLMIIKKHRRPPTHHPAPPHNPSRPGHYNPPRSHTNLS